MKYWGLGFFFFFGLTQANAFEPSPDSASEWCKQIKGSVQELKWKVDPCREIEWKVGGQSVQGRPLVYAEFGDPKSLNTTLIFSMVHGDEVTPLYIGFQLALWLKQWAAGVQERVKKGENVEPIRVVIAPLVNPDSFFRSPRTRTNARGVDVNRNFGTRDWSTKALATWKKRFRSDPRRFPGPHADSEPETLFQRTMIEKIKPQKILSIHAPLNFMDYDGPSQLTLRRFPRDYIQECLKLRDRLKARSGGFFTGSLGNFAGQELGIPTLTLELPSADARKAERYWQQFQKGIQQMITYSVPMVDALRPDRPK